MGSITRYLLLFYFERRKTCVWFRGHSTWFMCLVSQNEYKDQTMCLAPTSLMWSDVAYLVFDLDPECHISHPPSSSVSARLWSGRPLPPFVLSPLPPPPLPPPPPPPPPPPDDRRRPRSRRRLTLHSGRCSRASEVTPGDVTSHSRHVTPCTAGDVRSPTSGQWAGEAAVTRGSTGVT